MLTKVATLYYKSNLSQHEIAQRLGLSRQTVGRLLQQAHTTGIVRVEIRSPLARSVELEASLAECFHLQEAVVVQPAAETDEAIKEAIGEATAELLQRRVRDGDVLGVVSGCTTVNLCPTYLKPANIHDLVVVGLTGSAPRSPSETHAKSIVHRFAEAFGGRAVMLPAPSFVDRPAIKKSLLSDSNIAAVLELAHKANVALVGIGVLSKMSSPYRHGYVEYDLLRTIQAEGGVGEICGHAYDITGKLCSPEISARTIAVELDNLRSKELSIAVAGGLYKVDAIWGALQGRYCNVLVTDDATAAALLGRASEQNVRGQHVREQRANGRKRK